MLRSFFFFFFFCHEKYLMCSHNPPLAVRWSWCISEASAGRHPKAPAPLSLSSESMTTTTSWSFWCVSLSSRSKSMMSTRFFFFCRAEMLTRQRRWTVKAFSRLQIRSLVVTTRYNWGITPFAFLLLESISMRLRTLLSIYKKGSCWI